MSIAVARRDVRWQEARSAIYEVHCVACSFSGFQQPAEIVKRT